MYHLFGSSKTGLLIYFLTCWSILNNPQKHLGLHTKAKGVKLLLHHIKKTKQKINYTYKQAKWAKGLILMLRDKVLTDPACDGAVYLKL